VGTAGERVAECVKWAGSGAGGAVQDATKTSALCFGLQGSAKKKIIIVKLSTNYLHVPRARITHDAP
jgi:hypothetical protein